VWQKLYNNSQTDQTAEQKRKLYSEETGRQIKEQNKTENCMMRRQADQRAE
jgi:hypothetical protein